MPPTNSVDKPDRHQRTVDQRLLIEPMTKKTAAVNAIEIPNAFGKRSTYAISGTSPQTTNALKVVSAANHGERASRGNPYSSVSIVRTQRSRSAVINSTTRSRSAPAKPFAAKI